MAEMSQRRKQASRMYCALLLIATKVDVTSKPCVISKGPLPISTALDKIVNAVLQITTAF